MIRTLANTSSVEVATITYHAAHFAKLVTNEEEEKRHEVLRNRHIALPHDHNKLFIENVGLTKELAS